MNIYSRVLTLLSGMLFASTVCAQSGDVLYLGQRIAVEAEIVRFFADHDDGAAVRTRGGIKTSYNHRPLQSARTLSLQIQFSYNSYELTMSSARQLKPVGLALASNELRTLQFNIEGHTDATGSARYNMLLSEKRAETVQKYFMEHYGIDASRILVVPLGESQLLDSDQPNNGINRRVNIVANY